MGTMFYYTLEIHNADSLSALPESLTFSGREHTASVLAGVLDWQMSEGVPTGAGGVKGGLPLDQCVAGLMEYKGLEYILTEYAGEGFQSYAAVAGNKGLPRIFLYSDSRQAGIVLGPRDILNTLNLPASTDNTPGLDAFSESLLLLPRGLNPSPSHGLERKEDFDREKRHAFISKNTGVRQNLESARKISAEIRETVLHLELQGHPAGFTAKALFCNGSCAGLHAALGTLTAGFETDPWSYTGNTESWN